MALDILYAFPEDAGTYVCRAFNELGEATTQCTINVNPHSTLLLDPQNAASWERVQQLEAPRAAPVEAEPEAAKAPQFVAQMESLRRFEEQPAHFQTRLADLNSHVSIVWEKDGAPLRQSNKFRHANDFGLVSLTILHLVQDDAGKYRCTASNQSGTTSVEAELIVGKCSVSGGG